MPRGLVTRSVQLTPAESAALAELADRLHCSEGSLLRRFAAEGLRQAQLSEGIRSYVRGEATVAQAVRIAHLHEDEFGEQLRLRSLSGPGALAGGREDDADPLLASLRQLAESLGSQRLLDVVNRAAPHAGRQKPGAVNPDRRPPGG